MYSVQHSLVGFFTLLARLEHLTVIKLDCSQKLIRTLAPGQNVIPAITMDNVTSLQLSISFLELIALPNFVHFLVPMFTGLQDLTVMSQSSFSRNVDEESEIWRRHFPLVPNLTVYAKFFAYSRFIGPRYEERHNIDASEERLGVFGDIFRRLGELLRLVPQMHDIDDFRRQWEHLRNEFANVGDRN